MLLDYNEKNITLAKKLRKNATPQENYCHKAKLIIEIGGSQHDTEEGRQKDKFRTEILEGYDLKVIRFTNYQINTNFSWCLRAILGAWALPEAFAIQMRNRR